LTSSSTFDFLSGICWSETQDLDEIRKSMLISHQACETNEDWEISLLKWFLDAMCWWENTG